MSEEPNPSEAISAQRLAASDSGQQNATLPDSSSTPLSRRNFVTGLVGGGLLGGIAVWSTRTTQPSLSRNAARVPRPTPATAKNALAIPGLYPGRVVEVGHPGSLGTAVKNGYTERNREA